MSLNRPAIAAAPKKARSERGVKQTILGHIRSDPLPNKPQRASSGGGRKKYSCRAHNGSLMHAQLTPKNQADYATADR
jgi:hypothetical protein